MGFSNFSYSDFDSYINLLSEKYSVTNIVVLRNESTLKTEIEFNWTFKDGQTFVVKVPIDDIKFNNELRTLAEFIEPIVQNFVLSIGESVTGKYPFIRLYHDKHLGQYANLFGEPTREIEGWVFNRFKGQLDYPDGSFPVHSNNNSQVKPVFKQEYNIREVDMAKAKTRKIVRGKPAIDPTRIKRPMCVKHTTSEMLFNKVTNRWECTEEGCSVVARPKRDADDKTVVLGKGGVELRLIAQDGELSVVLISDDNVALNVTNMIDLPTLLDNFDVNNQAQAALDNGKDSFRVPEKNARLTTSLTVVGAEELLMMKV